MTPVFMHITLDRASCTLPTRGTKLLVINKRNREVTVSLPADAAGASLTYVAPSTGDHKPEPKPLAGTSMVLEPFEVAVVNYR
jgi:hypothetical protein